jgi:hypothetical protein
MKISQGYQAYFMFCLAIFQQHAGLVCENIRVVATNTVILGDTRVLGAPITAHWTKPQGANFVLEKIRLRECGRFWTPPPLSRNKPTFLRN